MRFVAISLVTILTILAILGTDHNGWPAQRQLSENLGYFVVTSSIGALLGVFATQEHYGGEGVLGLVTTVMAFYFATLIGALVAGTLMFPVVGTFLALLLLWNVPWSLGHGAIAWWCGALLLHFMTLHLLPVDDE